jgi:hypothetical protein
MHERYFLPIKVDPDDAPDKSVGSNDSSYMSRSSNFKMGEYPGNPNEVGELQRVNSLNDLRNSNVKNFEAIRRRSSPENNVLLSNIPDMSNVFLKIDDPESERAKKRGSSE